MKKAFGVDHFSKAVIKSLKSKGIEIVDTRALPDEKGSFLNSETGYLLNDNGTGRIKTYLQVLEIAK